MSTSEKTVLVIDDNDLQRRLTKTVLTHHGFRTIAANSGADALSILSKESVDIIVCDMQMPNMDGKQFTATIREQGDHKIPIIILTAEEPEDAEEPKSFGANAVCDKLDVNRVLVQQIREFLDLPSNE